MATPRGISNEDLGVQEVPPQDNSTGNFKNQSKECLWEILSMVKYSTNAMYLSCIDHVLGATTCHLEHTCLESLTTFLYYTGHPDQLSEVLDSSSPEAMPWVLSSPYWVWPQVEHLSQGKAGRAGSTGHLASQKLPQSVRWCKPEC